VDFLKLCQTVNTECGITGANQPTSVNNQSDILNHIVNWVRTADYTIQNLYFDWRFLWSSVTQVIPEGVVSIVPQLTMKHIDPESVQIVDGDERVNIQVIDYKQLRSIRSTSPAMPFVCAISPSNQIEFSQPADKNYQIYYEFHKKPVELENNTDVPLIPEEYHRCIVLQAKMYYAERYSVNEVAQEATKQYQQYFDRLRSDQLPGLTNLRTIQPEFMTVVVE